MMQSLPQLWQTDLNVSEITQNKAFHIPLRWRLVVTVLMVTSASPTLTPRTASSSGCLAGTSLTASPACSACCTWTRPTPPAVHRQGESEAGRNCFWHWKKTFMYAWNGQRHITSFVCCYLFNYSCSVFCSDQLKYLKLRVSAKALLLILLDPRWSMASVWTLSSASGRLTHGRQSWMSSTSGQVGYNFQKWFLI